MSKAANSPTEVKCPTCSASVLWVEENRYRPFCCKRCQLIDFGDWATEKNTIPVEGQPEDFNLDNQDEQ